VESDKKPRLPTVEEKAELVKYLAEDAAHGYTDGNNEALEDARRLADLAYIAVFDDYISGGPGYCGKVMVVVYDGGPYQTETYSWSPTTGYIVRDVEIQQ
jgi:hypothetical protein